MRVPGLPRKHNQHIGPTSNVLSYPDHKLTDFPDLNVVRSYKAGLRRIKMDLLPFILTAS